MREVREEPAQDPGRELGTGLPAVDAEAAEHVVGVQQGLHGAHRGEAVRARPAVRVPRAGAGLREGHGGGQEAGGRRDHVDQAGPGGVLVGPDLQGDVPVGRPDRELGGVGHEILGHVDDGVVAAPFQPRGRDRPVEVRHLPQCPGGERYRAVDVP
ncbi:hypothetical protein OG389_34185 [Streptomyces sp. NBC_00435]